MGLKHKLFGIVLLWPVLQGYAQEIKIGNYTFKDGAEYQESCSKANLTARASPTSKTETLMKANT